MQCVSNWLVELGELDATFRKADIAQLKSFITKDRDTLRRPYARKESKFARRTLFFASVNETNFLHDTTGNRRFWTIECVAINFKHGLDMQQVWAELYEAYCKGEQDYQQGNPKQWTLNADEMDALNDTNRDYEAVNPVHDTIDRMYDWDSPPHLWTTPMSATEIITQHANDKPNKADANTAASYVTKQYGVQWKKVGKNRDKRWMMPTKARHRLGDNDNDTPL
jgi:putative DNA primase/helicase